jgi:hypothetical protein
MPSIHFVLLPPLIYRILALTVLMKLMTAVLQQLRAPLGLHRVLGMMLQLLQVHMTRTPHTQTSSAFWCFARAA